MSEPALSSAPALPRPAAQAAAPPVAQAVPQAIAPRRAMLLAAGRGTRMAPLTDHTPKPLLPVAGRALIDRALDRLAAAGTREVVVNLHHLADRLAAHLQARAALRPPALRLLREDTLLETGGGVVNALPHLGEAPFYIVNGDSLWLDGPEAPALTRLAHAFDPARMDGLLLLCPLANARGHDEGGDFALEADGRLTRAGARPFVYMGVQILAPILLAPDRARQGQSFSLRGAWDRARAAGRLHGLVHDGAWFHVGTPAALALADAALADTDKTTLATADLSRVQP